MLHIAAQLAAPIIADEQANRPAFGLRLHRQLAARILEHRAEQRRDRERLDQQPFQRGGIAVRRKDRIQNGAKADEAATRVAFNQDESQRAIDVGIVHPISPKHQSRIDFWA